MAIRYYILPKAGTGALHVDPFRAKYIDNADGSRQIVGIATMMDYGAEPMFLVQAEVTAAEHTALAANADVQALPANVDSTIGANLATVQSRLESVAIPADWVTAAMTYRTMLQILVRLFAFMQRYVGQHGVKLFDASVTLATLYSALSPTVRQRLQTTAISFGVTDVTPPAGWTVRQVLRYIFERIPNGPFGAV